MDDAIRRGSALTNFRRGPYTPILPNFFRRNSSAMKRERRQELQTNTLAKWLAVKVEAVKPYITCIVGGMLAIVLIGVVVSIRSQRESTVSAEGWNRFQEANTEGFNALNENKTLELQDAVKRLEALAVEYAGTTLEYYVRLAIGDLHMRSGQGQARTNEAAAKQHFKDEPKFLRMFIHHG